MNHQATSSSFTPVPSIEPSAPVNGPALVTSDQAAATLAEAPQTKAKRKPQSSAVAKDSKPSAGQGDNRCRHYTFKGRRCRLTALDRASGLCFRHLGRESHLSDEDLSSAFAGQLSGFRSALDIHVFLAQLTILLVQNRVSTRRAAVLTYLGQTLLRTIPAVEAELSPLDEPQQWIFDLSRPKRDDDIRGSHLGAANDQKNSADLGKGSAISENQPKL